MHEIVKNMPPGMSKYTAFVKQPVRAIIGREEEFRRIQAALCRPEVSNIILLAPAGAGKTMLVQDAMVRDPQRMYLEIDLARMISDIVDANQLAARLKSLFNETIRFSADNGKDVVLFIDEFHLVVQLSDAAVEALKPLLADSGTRGIKVIAATTYVEFETHIKSNQPLVERLYRINVQETNRDTTVKILKNMAEEYDVSHLFYDDTIFENIYDYTNRYVPANSQPRKSILVLDAMLGWHRSEGKQIDQKLLADVIYESEGVRVAISVDGSKIRSALDEAVFAQRWATLAIEKRLQVAVAGFNDYTKPMATLLFSGSSGVGKTEMCKAMADVLFQTTRMLVRFDMTEYSQSESLERFREKLTFEIWKRPYCVLLFDEIEKASGDVTRLLLQVLDDGRLIDKYEREVSFINCYIVLTTNAASEVYKQIAAYSVDDEGAGQHLKEYFRLIRKSLLGEGSNKFPPELLNRIDSIVPFQPLSQNTLRRIAVKHLYLLRDRVKQAHGVKLYFVENEGDVRSVPDYIIKEEADFSTDAGGARGVIRRINDEVTSEVAKFVNENPNIKNIGCFVQGSVAYMDKSKRVSNAYISVIEAPKRTGGKADKTRMAARETKTGRK